MNVFGEVSIILSTAITLHLWALYGSLNTHIYLYYYVNVIVAMNKSTLINVIY